MIENNFRVEDRTKGKIEKPGTHVQLDKRVGHKEGSIQERFQPVQEYKLRAQNGYLSLSHPQMNQPNIIQSNINLLVLVLLLILTLPFLINI